MTLREWLDRQNDLAEEQNLAADACLTLKKGAGRSLKTGGGWIYDNEVDRLEGSYENGDIIRVADYDGYPLGYGFLNTLSKIRVRMLARYRKDPITPAFLKARVRDAWTYRRAVIDTGACRLIFGEADFLPGLTVDKFGDILVIESLCLGADRYKLLVLKELVRLLAEDGIPIRGIYERSEAKVRSLEGLQRSRGFIGPEFDPLVPMEENGVRYLVDVKDGQKTGFFLDQKKNRAAVADLVRRMQGPSVLDCFTHTGSFGLNCALAGASRVLSVDASDLAIRQAMENARLNSLEPGLLQTSDLTPSGASDNMLRASVPAGDASVLSPAAHAFAGLHPSHLPEGISYLTADVFDLLPSLEEAGCRYDLVILDPPAFTKSRQATKQAIKGYREINLRGLKLVREGGFLATCSCSHFMEEDLFKRTLREAARGARKRLRQVEFRTQAPDHPILWGDDASYYLKFLIFQVVTEQ